MSNPKNPAAELSAATEADRPGASPERTISVVLDRRSTNVSPALLASVPCEEAHAWPAPGIDVASDLGTAGDPVSLATKRASLPAPGSLRTTASLLDPLTGAGLAGLRREVADGLRSGRPVLLCPACEEPVHVAVTSVAEAGTVGGRRAFLKHGRRSPDAAPCPLGRSATRARRAVDAERFDGAQEGQWHAATKAELLRGCLNDPDVQFVAVEVRVPVTTPRGPSWRRPDLLVSHTAGTAAIEVQGARPLLATIAGREADLAGEGVGVLWVLDGSRPDRLELQGFQDIHGVRDGVVHARDAGTRAATALAGHLLLRHWRVGEQDDRLVIVEDRLVTLEEAIAETVARLPSEVGRGARPQDGVATASPMGDGGHRDGSERDGPSDTLPPRNVVEPSAPPANASLASLLDSVAAGRFDGAARAFGHLAAALDLPLGWGEAERDGLPWALGAARTALTGWRGLPYEMPDDRWAATLNSFLIGKGADDWVPLLLRTCRGDAAAQARLAWPSTARKIRDAQARVARTPERARALDHRWSAVFEQLVQHCRQAQAMSAA